MKINFLLILLFLFQFHLMGQGKNQVSIRPDNEPVAKGKFEPTWESLSQYQVPEWFRNAKFGIWAHWGPQCQPGQGDWYARFMYQEGSRQYKWHVENYGHPSVFGFKDVINSWNTVRVGPHKDILAGWAEAAGKNNLPFGLSVHAAHAWSWLETSQQSDKTGDFAGIPYDGRLNAKDGKGKWWDGLDPQELYAQNHPLSEGSEDINKIHSQWAWGNGVAVPSQEYCEKFYNRTMDMINKFNPICYIRKDTY